MFTVSCKKLCKTFRQGDREVKGLDEVDFEVAAGEFICVSGPSGSGKTTLLNAIGGLDRPDSGEVLVADLRIDQMSKSDLADFRLAHVGFVFQAYNLIPVLSAQENVEFVMQMQGMSGADRSSKAREILKEVGLEGMEDRRPGQLSGGQQQRVAVARAIVSRPELILADEPTANLDSKSMTHLMELFVELNQRYGSTFLIATHDARVMQYAKRLVTMVDGKIVKDVTQEPTPVAA